MEFDGDYLPLGMNIDGPIRQKYEDAFEDLEQTDSYVEGLKSIARMVEALGESRPDNGRGVVWARDMIEAYRTVGKLFTEYTKLGKNLGIEEILEDHQCLLREFNGETDKERVYLALQDLTEIYEIFREYDLNEKKELKDELEKLKGVRERSEYLSELENLESDVEDFENSFA